MDIVERLREGKSAGGYWREKEAADEIERLREVAKDWPKDRPNDAADEIERLRELSNARGEQVKRLCDEIERLREALRLERQLKDDALRAFNEARAALKEGE